MRHIGWKCNNRWGIFMQRSEVGYSKRSWEAHTSLTLFLFPQTNWIGEGYAYWASYQQRRTRGWGGPHDALRSPFIKLQAEPWQWEVPPDQTIHTYFISAAPKFPSITPCMNPVVSTWVPAPPSVPPAHHVQQKWVVVCTSHLRQFFHWVEISAAPGDRRR